MSYEIGTAENYTDLLERLMDFISNPLREIASGDTSITELVPIDGDVGSGEDSQVWTIDRWEDDRDSSGVGNIEMIAHGPGSTASDEIYVGIQTYGSSVLGYYNWKLQGFTGYSVGDDHDVQPGAILSNIPRMLLWNGSISYWFFANGRRFHVVAKIDTVYEQCYLGFYLPYGTPVQMSYPLLVGGSSTDGNTLYSAIENSHRAFFDPGDSNTESTLLLYYNAWYHFCNFVNETAGADLRNVWPWQPGNQGTGKVYDKWRELKGAMDMNPVLFPLIMMSAVGSPSRDVFGEIENCFAISLDTGIVSEDIITVGVDDYIVFENIYRKNTYNYCAIKKE